MCRIRPVNVTDIEMIVEIENRCFPKPWNRSVFEAICTWHGNLRLEAKRIILMRVLEFEETVIGYIIWEENHLSLKGHIMNLAVSEDHRGKGWGEKLLKYGINMMRSHDIKLCMLEVRESNSAAQALYEKVGMEQEEIVEDYYDEEDAILYVLYLD